MSRCTIATQATMGRLLNEVSRISLKDIPCCRASIFSHKSNFLALFDRIWLRYSISTKITRNWFLHRKPPSEKPSSEQFCSYLREFPSDFLENFTQYVFSYELHDVHIHFSVKCEKKWANPFLWSSSTAVWQRKCENFVLIVFPISSIEFADFFFSRTSTLELSKTQVETLGYRRVGEFCPWQLSQRTIHWRSKKHPRFDKAFIENTIAVLHIRQYAGSSTDRDQLSLSSPLRDGRRFIEENFVPFNGFSSTTIGSFLSQFASESCWSEH